jgi:superfamily II DNA or RNA helicase
VRSRLAEGVHRQLIAMPTGSGKTVVFANLPDLLKNVLPGQIMVVAHREELLDQAADKIHKWNPTLTVSVEQADRFATGSKRLCPEVAHGQMRIHCAPRRARSGNAQT